ncbi:MAG: hypothetical protein LKK03_01425 [Candidatus Methanomethylophilus sp.]|jgi:hypothetical protein|nr:hypothetical protein [Methanomethylophilus sp.]
MTAGACMNCGKYSKNLSDAAAHSGDVFSVCRECAARFAGKELDYYLARKEVRI